MLEKLKRRLVLTGCLLIVIFALSLFPADAEVVRSEGFSAGEVLSNNKEIVRAVRDGLKSCSRKIRISFKHDRDIGKYLTSFAEEWMEDAMAETLSPVEGDYLRYRLGGYKIETVSEKNQKGYIYEVKIIPKYYTYLVQEEELDLKIAEIFEELELNGKTSDYEKIFAIYDYICSHVSYDKVHKKNPYYFLRSTAYAALVQGTATCQGYSAALYRMLKEAGINSRIITGTARGEEEGTLHAWNIAEIYGLYYNLDATWDSGKENYEYFLRGEADFSDHRSKEEFLKEDFRLTYPMAEKSIDWRE